MKRGQRVGMGDGHGTQTAASGAQECIDLLRVKTAKALGLDLRIRHRQRKENGHGEPDRHDHRA
jgi:hypothetical protein